MNNLSCSFELSWSGFQIDRLHSYCIQYGVDFPDTTIPSHAEEVILLNNCIVCYDCCYGDT